MNAEVNQFAGRVLGIGLGISLGTILGWYLWGWADSLMRKRELDKFKKRRGNSQGPSVD